MWPVRIDTHVHLSRISSASVVGAACSHLLRVLHFALGAAFGGWPASCKSLLPGASGSWVELSSHAYLTCYAPVCTYGRLHGSAALPGSITFSWLVGRAKQPCMPHLRSWLERHSCAPPLESLRVCHPIDASVAGAGCHRLTHAASRIGCRLLWAGLLPVWASPLLVDADVVERLRFCFLTVRARLTPAQSHS